ncbi:prephenate/arogenate dehydrogenase family protein [Breoghania sp. L-A4]|uniref:prephenate/arogenate dehydrogenase family protein n=1 Tax=Breoghania sp. L-A4 TaxID=2304600 RepID=UPI000E35F46E|nr:prephenate/arogenate dehydrogenase family protein [Breoghania sp. L-A4]AXS38850.1 prephenate/arogenate dehydrogenase family protein [Breoghania sp. L-A4]
MSDPLFRRLTLIGIGLIGSSLARVVRREGLAGEIVISTRSPQTLARAEELALGDRYCLDAAEAVEGADLVILCVPVGASAAVAKWIAPALAPGAIVTDVGSTKASVVAQMQPHLPANVHFIPGHPIAGTEYSGPDAGFAALFENRWCILTPVEGTDPAAQEKLSAFWRGCGSNIDVMDPDHHDLVLAITSHLPHIIAYNIVGTADDLQTVTKSEVIKYSASGFRDFTRLAASDPTMWRDVCLHNKDAILEMLSRFSEDLSAVQRAIRWGDGQALFDLFTRTRGIRRSIIEAGQETDEPDFGRHHGEA